MMWKAFRRFRNRSNVSLFTAVSVLIWPQDDSVYGHAAIRTKNYHISFWPTVDKKKKPSSGENKGALHYHHEYDRYLEYNKKPKVYELPNLSDDKVEAIYHKVLDYNKIFPYTKVSISEGETIVDRAFEIGFEEGWPDGYEPEKVTSKTSYFLDPTISNQYDWAFPADIFFHYPQSCTTFAYAILKLSGAKLRSYAVPTVTGEGLRPPLSVAIFEDIVKSYVKDGDDNPSTCSIS